MVYNVAYASDKSVNGLISDVKGSGKNKIDTGSYSITKAINKAIGLLRVIGTGISIVVMSMLGIKYMQASPSDKADTKKQILPILIGCLLVFGAVNLVAAVADFALKIGE